MNTFNVLIDFLVTNGDPADIEGGEEQVEDEIPSPQREILASIDSEMTLAREMLNRLTQRRNEVHRELFMKTAPSPEERKNLLDVIAGKEHDLMRLQTEATETRSELDTLLRCKDSEMGSAEDSDCKGDARREYSLMLAGRQTVPYCAGLHQERLEHLISSQKTIENDLEVLRGVLSPIRKLPPEILSSIFLETLLDEDFTPNICSSWRKIALHTPELWSSISISEVRSKPSPQIPLMECWIQRSGVSYISFKVVEERRFASTVSLLSRILDIYIPHYARWRKVHLMYGSTFSLRSGFGVLPPDAVFPMLESLYLERSQFLEQKEIELISRMLLSAPRLRSVSWISGTLYTSFSVPWAQLSQLIIDHPIPMSDVIRILSDCSDLQDVELSLMPDFQSLDDSSSETVLMHCTLQRLKLHVLVDTKPLFNRLQLPRLKHLSLEMLRSIRPEIVPQEANWLNEEFISFLSRSGCSLDYFSLSDFDTSPEDLICCLRHSSTTLKELHLNNERNRKEYVDDQVLRLMTYWPALSDSTTTSDVAENLKEPLCPYIHTLKLWGCISSTDGVLAQMLDSRWRAREMHWAGSQMQVVLIGLHDADSQHPLDAERVRRMNEKRSGISVIRL
ncbi:hypothetical protein BDQ17DRAFT_1358480 [Cyathus striatus]|nr:hypothetical protein BDQ17DRAFT_1358480 [Cyathus striatus]